MTTDDEAGYSLVELLVAMLVAGILFVAVGTVFIGVTRTVRTVNVRTSTGADVRIAMEEMTRTFRVAYQPNGEAAAFTSATANSVTFYALLNRSGPTATAQPLPMKVTYTYSSNCLYETQTPAASIATPSANGPFYTWTGGGTRCLLRTGTAPVFTYYSDGVTSTALDLSSGSLSSTDLGNVQSVDILLTASDPASPGVHPVPAESRVTLVNLSS